jgi:hypothetical protein
MDDAIVAGFSDFSFFIAIGVEVDLFAASNFLYLRMDCTIGVRTLFCIK